MQGIAGGLPSGGTEGKKDKISEGTRELELV